MANEMQSSGRRDLREPDGRGDAPFVVPPVDIFENDSAITLLADVPGAARDRLQVRVNGATLWIEAEATSAGPDGMEIVHAEAQVPSYRRQFTLSRELDPSRIEANLKDGVLSVVIPKLEQARPRRIEVRAG